MAIDTPAKIAILGAGPIGLEAALYARFLGYDVAIYEAGEVADSVLRWGHVRMFTPFRMNRSTLGLAAIGAHDESYRPPNDDDLLTGREWAERYLMPLSQTDLLSDHLQLRTTVVGIGKEELLKGDLPGHEDRGDWPFRLLTRDASGNERIDLADAVIDATGVFRQPNWMGQGGLPAVGELALRDQIEYHLPDILGRKRDEYAGRHTLVVGAGYSAATHVVALVQLAKESPGTQVTWITRRTSAADTPLQLIPEDRLPERDALARKVNELASRGEVRWLPGTVVESIGKTPAGAFEILLAGQHGGAQMFDRIIANVGYRPDRALYEELQMHECYASQGPMKLAAALLGQASADCLDQVSCGPQALLNPEPNFYVLGAKSYGRKSNFLFAVGLDQVREVFTMIGDRATLNLYAGAMNLLK